MPAAKHIIESMNSSSWIRKMFEEGNTLRAQFGAENVYDFSLGNPDLEPPQEITDAMRKIVNSGEKGLHAYMPNAGYIETRSAIAKKVSREQFSALKNAEGTYEPLCAQHVVMSVGAAGALNSVFKAVLNADDEVIIPAPYFAEYGHYINNHGGRLVTAKTKEDFALDITSIEKALSVKTKAVLINSPNNPSGKIYSDDDIAKLSALLNAHGKRYGIFPYLIADEPYREITYNGKKVAAIFPAYEHSVVVSSFAKNLSLPGERIGYIAVNPACPDSGEFIAACTFTTRILGYVNAPAFFQRVIAQCWDCKVDYSSYAKRRDMLTAILRKAGISYAEPEGAFYLFCKVPPQNSNECGDDIAFSNHLKKYNVLAVPGIGFGCAGYVRLAYCVSEQTICNSENAFCTAIKDWRK